MIEGPSSTCGIAQSRPCGHASCAGRPSTQRRQGSHSSRKHNNMAEFSMATRSAILLLMSALFSMAFQTLGNAQSNGTFKGNIDTRWSIDGRLMILLQPFAYVDPRGVEWSAPKGLATDGASIPGFLWSIIGGPFEGKYRAAAVIHDVYCITKSRPHDQVHKVFYEASIAAGESPRKAWIMYKGVEKFGPRWANIKQRDPKCDKFDNVSAVECTLNSADTPEAARQPNQAEIEEFFSQMRQEGYESEANELQSKLKR